MWPENCVTQKHPSHRQFTLCFWQRREKRVLQEQSTGESWEWQGWSHPHPRSSPAATVLPWPCSRVLLQPRAGGWGTGWDTALGHKSPPALCRASIQAFPDPLPQFCRCWFCSAHHDVMQTGSAHFFQVHFSVSPAPFLLPSSLHAGTRRTQAELFL